MEDDASPRAGVLDGIKRKKWTEHKHSPLFFLTVDQLLQASDTRIFPTMMDCFHKL